jgi:hypothetical protein
MSGYVRWLLTRCSGGEGDLLECRDGGQFGTLGGEDSVEPRFGVCRDIVGRVGMEAGALGRAAPFAEEIEANPAVVDSFGGAGEHAAAEWGAVQGDDCEAA